VPPACSGATDAEPRRPPGPLSPPRSVAVDNLRDHAQVVPPRLALRAKRRAVGECQPPARVAASTTVALLLAAPRGRLAPQTSGAATAWRPRARRRSYFQSAPWQLAGHGNVGNERSGQPPTGQGRGRQIGSIALGRLLLRGCGGRDVSAGSHQASPPTRLLPESLWDRLQPRCADRTERPARLIWRLSLSRGVVDRHSAVLLSSAVDLVGRPAAWATCVSGRRAVRLICAGWLPQDGRFGLERFRWSRCRASPEKSLRGKVSRVAHSRIAGRSTRCRHRAAGRPVRGGLERAPGVSRRGPCRCP